MVDKKLELSSAVYLAYLSAVSIDKNPRTRRKKLKKDRRRSMPRCYRLCVLIGPGPRGGGSSLVHGLWRHPLWECRGSSLVSSEMSPWGIGQLLPAGRIGKMSFREDDPVEGGRKFEADRHSTLLAGHVQPWHQKKIKIIMHPVLLNLFWMDSIIQSCNILT